MKHPPFISYDFQPSFVILFGTETERYRGSLRALARNGTIWATHQRSDGTWLPWEMVGEVPE